MAEDFEDNGGGGSKGRWFLLLVAVVAISVFFAHESGCSVVKKTEQLEWVN